MRRLVPTRAVNPGEGGKNRQDHHFSAIVTIPDLLPKMVDSIMSYSYVTNQQRHIDKYVQSYTGRFIMYSGITKIYYRKTVGHVFTKPVRIGGTTQNFFFPQLSCFSA
jgi:hypothetical protein